VNESSAVARDGLPPAAPMVLIIEDHEMLAEALASALRVTGAETGVVRARCPDDVVDAVRRHRPRLVLLDLDLGLPDLSGDVLVSCLVDSGAAVVLLTGCRDRATLGRCLAAGADGIVSKEAGLAALLDVVGRVLRGDSLPGRDEREALIAEAREQRALDAQRLAPFMQLTRREAQVLRALVDGRSVEAVAADSFVSVATVRSQVRAILLKIGVSSQLAAVAAARRSGWLDARSSAAT
jgi:two-component system nitrate/nitrite response regulator NarL